MKSLTITRPDDWHLHLRDNAELEITAKHAAMSFERAIIMPNLIPPVDSVDKAMRYHARILKHTQGSSFKPLMTLYLSENLNPTEIRLAETQSEVVAVKWYPKGVTTHSDAGVPDMAHHYDTLQAMSDANIPLLIHGEVADPEVDIFDRETLFLEQQLAPIIENFPNLKIVLEHISTLAAAEFVEKAPSQMAATITAHHLFLNRNDLLSGGLRPHHYCLPIVKRKADQAALVQAATSGNPKFFIGTDSAPHAKHKKESACGCAGIYTAPIALPLYAQVFEQAGKLENLEAFCAFHGPDFYGQPRNRQSVKLIEKAWQVPESYAYANERLIPFMAGQTLNWQVEG